MKIWKIRTITTKIIQMFTKINNSVEETKSKNIYLVKHSTLNGFSNDTTRNPLQ